ncbi:hypothetical protein MPH_09355 [Macrophomina phaseolina MS6]|uniref:Uncharacterized protein n=1 Tax=Macrophomina phaseolina (strain MS6) TaxID=1126212 RepID=K2RKZ6_MACPH|nr:hypothetical protein MPH_09355 [Macrophomina phaseolina MS6]
MKGFCFLGGGHDRYLRGAMGLKKPNDDDFPSWHRRGDGFMVPTQRLPRGIFLPERSHLSEVQTIDHAPYSTPQPVPEPANKGMKEDPLTPLGAFVAGRSLRRKRAMVARHLGQSPEAAIYQPSVARFKCCAEEERYEDILLSTAGASGKMLAGLRIDEDSLGRIVDSSDSAAGHAGDSALAENEREQTAALHGDKSISPLVESGEDGLVTHGSSDVQIDDEVTLDSISAIGLSPAVSARLNTPFTIVKLNSGPLNPIAEALEESAEEMADETGGGCETESEREPTGPTGEAKELQLTKEKDLTGWTSSATFVGTISGSAAEETLAGRKISGKISGGCNHLNLEDFENAPPDSFSDVDVGPSGPGAFAPVPGHKAAPQRKNMSFSSIFDGANNPFPGPPAAHWWQQPNQKPTEPPTNSTPEPIRSDDVPLLPGQVFP